MSDPNEFTPKEKYIISLYKDPAGLFRKSLQRTLLITVPSVGLLIYAFIVRDIVLGIIAYVLLLAFIISRVIILKRGLGTTRSIILKFEAQLQAKKDAL